MRLTDGINLVEIRMNIWDEERQQYGPDFAGEFFADVERYLDGSEAWLVDDVQYCIDYANDWAEGKGDFMEEADDPEVVNGNRCVDVDFLDDLPPKAIYSQLSDIELSDLVAEYALGFEEGLDKSELADVTAEDIREFWKSAGCMWTDVMLDNMDKDELEEFSEAIARRVHDDAEEEEGEPYIY